MECDELVSQQSTSSRCSQLRLLSAVLTIFVTLYAFLRSATEKISHRICSLILSSARSLSYAILAPDLKEDFRRPSDTEFRSLILRRLGELEEKINMLQTMPSVKGELHNAQLHRLDVFEADLIAAKKALHEALMMQENLLAYFNAQESRRKFCF